MADLVFPGKTTSILNAGAMPANTDMQIYKGDYVEIFVTLKNASGVAISLTNLTPRAILKETYSGTSVAAFTCTPTGVTGEVRIYLSSTESANLTKDSYIWDFEVVNSNGDTRTYLTGDVSVSPEVTTG